MLLELIIKDFAIIDTLTLRFENGLNILSGETGAGKSIIVGAVNLLLGGRASADMIRSSKKDAVVEAVFSFDDNTGVQTLLSEWGMVTENHQVIIRRLISRNGKNRIYLSGQLANLQMLNRLGSALIDISGQYSQQLLLQTEHHIDILDTYGGHTDIFSNYKDKLNTYYKDLETLNKLNERARQLKDQQELYTFQKEELEKASLDPDEEEALLQERNVLTHAKELYDKAYGTYLHLYENDNSLISTINSCLKNIKEAAEIDAALGPQRNGLESVTLELDDIARDLRSYANGIHVDPERLELVESRLNMLYRLKKKYNKDINGLIEYRQFLEKQLTTIETSDHEAEQLCKILIRRADELWSMADTLSQKRNKLSGKFKKNVEKELVSIGMDKTEFTVRIHSVAKNTSIDPASAIQGLTSSGKDTVEFFISPNKGEDQKALSKIASGGELSRIVLVIKKILAEKYLTPTLLFDEVDTGIGGAVAEAVGQKLNEISKSHQVLCITHLPQIAAFGDTHFTVTKDSTDNRTVTRVSRLNKQGRITELSRMLGGKHITDKTQAHAVEMLKNARIQQP